MFCSPYVYIILYIKYIYCLYIYIHIHVHTCADLFHADMPIPIPRLQIRTLIRSNIQDAIRRYGGSTAPTMPWPQEHEEKLTPRQWDVWQIGVLEGTSIN